jgi:hypothetical protein
MAGPVPPGQPRIFGGSSDLLHRSADSARSSRVQRIGHGLDLIRYEFPTSRPSVPPRPRRLQPARSGPWLPPLTSATAPPRPLHGTTPRVSMIQGLRTREGPPLTPRIMPGTKSPPSSSAAPPGPPRRLPKTRRDLLTGLRRTCDPSSISPTRGTGSSRHSSRRSPRDGSGGPGGPRSSVHPGRSGPIR